MITKWYWYIGIVALLPLSIWYMASSLSRMIHPWQIAGIMGLTFLLLCTLIGWLTARWVKKFEDSKRTIVLLSLFIAMIILPAALWLNANITLGNQYYLGEVLDSASDKRSTDTYVFVWLDDAMVRFDTRAGDPIGSAIPGDSVIVRVSRGLLNMQYYADIAILP